MMVKNPEIIAAVEQALAGDTRDVFGTVDVARLLNRDTDTVSMHARKHERAGEQIGTRFNGKNWLFSRADVLKLARIIARGSGRRPYKFINEQA